MTEPGSNLAAHLAAATSAGPVPERGDEVLAYVGDRRSLQQVLSGRSGPAGPKRDTAAWREANNAWRTAGRRIQRWTAGEGRQRRELAGLSAAQRREIRSIATSIRESDLRRRGFRTRLRASVTISSGKKKGDTRVRIMPAHGVPGVSFAPVEARVVLDPGLSWDDAAALYWDIFKEKYSLPAGAVVGTVYWVRLWPRGGREPE